MADAKQLILVWSPGKESPVHEYVGSSYHH
jgi:hypothetical protein